jgi:hypothetical protein
MFNIPFGSPNRRYCDGVSRRQMLRFGSTGLFGGLTLPHLLQADDAPEASRKAKAMSCIFIFLEGGPPQQDMWDPKPDAPAEIRGVFQTIPTKTPGVFFSEHCK